ncbi:MAG: hypothetical protein HZB41_10810 [Ignavibacteriae bacterium]|nr:hypothetical protein [Ignavibacteriota bacterium]
MKRGFKYLLLLMCLLNVAGNLYSQPSSPVPYDLSNGSYQLSGWDSSSAINPAGTYPPNMVFHQTKKIDPQLLDEMDTDWECPYYLDTRSRINGLGDNGIGFINTGQTQDDSVCFYPGHVGEAVLAIRTVHYKNINVKWTAGLVSLSGSSNRQYCIRFQYRLGNSGDFRDIPDSSGYPVEYNYSGYLNNYPHPPHEKLFDVILPQDCDDRILVQLRWKYYYIPNDSASGTRPKMKVDDIKVKGDRISTVDKHSINMISDCSIEINNLDSKICLSFYSHYKEQLNIGIYDLMGNEIIKINGYNTDFGVNKLGIDLPKRNFNGVFFIRVIGKFSNFISKFYLVN